MSSPEDGITLRPGTDISVSPEELEAPEQPDPGSPEPESMSEQDAMGGTGGADAGGAG